MLVANSKLSQFQPDLPKRFVSPESKEHRINAITAMMAEYGIVIRDIEYGSGVTYNAVWNAIHGRYVSEQSLQAIESYAFRVRVECIPVSVVKTWVDRCRKLGTSLGAVAKKAGLHRVTGIRLCHEKWQDCAKQKTVAAIEKTMRKIEKGGN